MDLDDKELKATRKLNGVAKDSNIEIIEDFINEIKDFELNKDVVEIVNALEDILEEREADKKRIKELEEENSDLKIKNNSRIIGSYAEVRLEEILKEDYIPVQKVKDKIEENKRLIDETDSEDIMQKLTDENEILEELLEDK